MSEIAAPNSLHSKSYRLPLRDVVRVRPSSVGLMPRRLPRVFTGSQHAESLAPRGVLAKQWLVDMRTGKQSNLDEMRCSTAPPGSRTPRNGKRCFSNAPAQQSIVDQVVFGRDMDASGEDQYDDNFMAMFKDAVGITREVLDRPKSIKVFPCIPTMQSVVDQVVFGRDMDFSGEDQFDEEFMAMFVGAAGRPSVVQKKSSN
mmetsp:Transcript_105765/g.165059  ORF Transcript_105765/g.165059 Transcript_105765/m.165059 type:complete len:201 (-) Transcript_105765:177-779(-)